jgi:hypothetical protein
MFMIIMVVIFVGVSIIESLGIVMMMVFVAVSMTVVMVCKIMAEVDPGIVESYAPHDDERIMNSVQAHFRHDLADHDHSHGDSHEDHHHDNPEALNDGHSHEDHHHDDHKHDHSKPKNTAGGR